MRPYYPDHSAGREKKSQTATPLPKAAEPEAAIPELREKEKERKGGGLWIAGSGSGPSGTLLGSSDMLRVGASLARPGFLGSGRVAAALARMFGGPGTFLGGLFASSAGSPLVLMGMAVFSGLMAAAAIHLLDGFHRPATGNQASLPTSGITSASIVIDKPGDRSLGYLIAANEGEIQWDKSERPAAEEPPAKAEEAPPQDAVKEPPKPAVPNVDQLLAQVTAKAQLKGDGFLKDITNKGAMGSFGLGAGGLRDGLAGFNLKKTFAPKSVTLGKVKPMDRSKRNMKASAKTVQTGRSGRAMGQLKLARNMSAFGAKAPTDAAKRQYATDAFEQGRTIGGEMPEGIGGNGIVVPTGDGAPGISDDTADNVTPYQPQVDAARALDNDGSQKKNQGDMLKMIGAILMAIGAMLMAMGMALMSNHTTFPIGIALFIVGLILLILGAMLIAMGNALNNQAKKQANQAKNQGQQIEQQYGQPDQGANIDECSDQAANGIHTAGCQTSRGPDYYNDKLTNTLHDDVEQEMNANYTLH